MNFDLPQTTENIKSFATIVADFLKMESIQSEAGSESLDILLNNPDTYFVLSIHKNDPKFNSKLTDTMLGKINPILGIQKILDPQPNFEKYGYYLDTANEIATNI